MCTYTVAASLQGTRSAGLTDVQKGAFLQNNLSSKAVELSRYGSVYPVLILPLMQAAVAPLTSLRLKRLILAEDLVLFFFFFAMFLIRKDLCYLYCRVVLLQVRCSYHPCFSNQCNFAFLPRKCWMLRGSLRWKCLTVNKTWEKCTKEYREEWIKVYLPAGHSVYPFLCSSRVRGQLVTVSQPGVCRYGSRMDCCYGWKKNSKGHCEGNTNSLCLFLLSMAVYLVQINGLDVNLPEVTEESLWGSEVSYHLGRRMKKTCWREYLLKKEEL